MGEETSQRGLPTTTGFAAREAIAMLRKHNIATAPLLLRAGLSEHGLARAADEGNSLPLRVSARASCAWVESERDSRISEILISTCWLGGGQQEMAKPYSQDLPDRVIDAVKRGK